MNYDNEMCLTLKSNSINESLARVSVAAFVSQLDPFLNDVEDIKVAVSEAVTNAIIHGYTDKNSDIHIYCAYKGGDVYIEIKDEGIGIADITLAKEPLYTSKPDMERSGMGFSLMQEFMDTLEVISEKGCGTTIKMTKKLV